MKALLVLPILLLTEALLFATLGLSSIQTGLQTVSSALGVPYNTFVVLLGTGLLGLASGIVGLFAVLRQRSLVGDAVAHSALPGLALAYMIIGERNFTAMLAGAVISGLLGGFLISWLQKNTRIKADAAIGIVLSVLFGLGLVLSSIVQDDPSGRQAGLDSFLLGKTAGMIGQDVLLIGLMALNVVVVVGLTFKELKLITFDPNFGKVQGLPVLALDAILMALLVLTTVIGLPAVGVVLMAAMLIIPGVSARFWTDRLGRVMLLSAMFGLISALLGTWISSRVSDLPAGAIIVLTGAAVFLFSMLFAPRRGVLARGWLSLHTEWKIARQNLLRTLYEVNEPSLPDRTEVSLSEILATRAWRRSTAKALLLFANWKKEVLPRGADRWVLTDSGLKQAAQIVKAHRLWEIFLVEQASIAPDHVDRDADEIEHVLTPKILAELESRLQEQGRLPEFAPPSSVHPVGEGV